MKKPLFYRLFNYNKNLLPNKFLKNLEELSPNLEDAKKHTGFSIGYPGWNVIYFLLLTTVERHSKNIVIVETGSNLGSTTIILAQALKDLDCADSKVISIEIDKTSYLKAKENIKKSGLLDYIDLINDHSINYLEKKNILNIDFAFIDGSHLMNDAYSEFELLFPKLKQNSLILIDNTYNIAEDHEDQRVYGAIKKIKENFKNIQVINLTFVSWYTPGLAIIQKI